MSRAGREQAIIRSVSTLEAYYVFSGLDLFNLAVRLDKFAIERVQTSIKEDFPSFLGTICVDLDS